MSYCLNPHCPKPADPVNADNRICRHCGSALLLPQGYRVSHLLGEGGFAKTFELSCSGRSPKVLKVLLDTNPKAIALFRREAQVLSSLNHPGIPHVEPDGYFTFWPRDSHQPLHCLVMEKIEGTNLEQWMHGRYHQPIATDLAVRWFVQLVEILDRVHRQHYFHRDIKPSNIMLQPDGQLALIDFGSAREVTGTYLVKVGGGQKMTGIVSPGYTPPEQSNGKAVPQSDFFALGRTFVYLLTGKEPGEFPEDSRTGQLLWRDRAGRALVGRDRQTQALADLIDYTIATFPGNRPQNTQVILQCLQDIARQTPQFGSTPPPTTPNPAPQAGNGRSPHPAIARIRTYYSGVAVPAKLQQFAPARHSRRRSRTKQKRKRIARFKNLLAGGFVLGVGLSATHFYGYLDFPPLSRAIASLSQPQTPITEVAVKSQIDLGLGPSSAQRIAAPELKLVKTLNTLWAVNSVALNPNLGAIASGTADKMVTIWDWQTGETRYTLSGHTQQIWSVAIAPDGNTLASASADGSIKLWNPRNGELLRTLTGHQMSVLSVAFSPDSQRLASGGYENEIKLWNPTTGQLLHTLVGHQGWVFAVAFSPDNERLASGSLDRTIKIWHLGTGELMQTLTLGSERVRSIAFSPDGQLIAGGRGDGRIEIWHLNSGRRLAILYGHSDAVYTLAFDPQGQRLVSGGGPLDPTIKLWQLSTGELLQVIESHTGTVHSLAIAADGKRLVSGSEDNTIQLWQLHSP
ncbi:MAG: hypothetical protein D6680_07520 [Cyanobacteria bacterium J007]|nr:MAG: hypothetical protein D6680_07520 [Cyanobacteria bacterium J007]